MTKDSSDGTEIGGFANGISGTWDETYANCGSNELVALILTERVRSTKQSRSHDILDYSFPEIVLSKVIPDLHSLLHHISTAVPKCRFFVCHCGMLRSCET